MFSKFSEKQLTGIRRILYVHDGVVRDTDGPLELTFDDGASVWFDVGEDGESLSVNSGAWVDPFKDPISEENRIYIEKSGKWTAFDLSGSNCMSKVLGSQIGQIDEVRDPSGKVVGVRLHLDDVEIKVTVDSDELLVDIG